MSSLLYKYNPDMKFPEAELRKNHTQFVDSSIFQQPPPPQPPQQQQQQSSGLTRYRSAPSSLLVELLNNNGGGNEDFPYRRTSSPEVETVLTSFISSCNEPELPEHQFEERPVKQETRDSVSKQSGSGGAGGGYSNSSHMMYQEAQQLLALDTSFNPINPPGLVGNRSNLIRQSSSPAGFFPNLSIDNGFNGMKEGAIYRAGNGTSGEAASPSSSRAHNQLNFSSGSSSYLHRMHQISENGNGNMGEGSQLQDHSNGNGGNSSHYNVSSSFPNDSWEPSSFNDFKRARDNDGNKFSTSTALETHQNNDFGHRNHGLTHHMSLPNHFEIPAVEKFLQFEDSIPCKIRAKRGFATHPRSIAERMRRTRISERMKKLQDLFPDMDKQINTAEMLDLAVDYIKDLQKQVKTLRDTKAKCSCSSN